MSAERGRWGPPLALLFVTLPFLGKAHHVDDPLYLRAARQVLDSPLYPLSGESFWHEAPTTLFSDLYNPPLTAYWLAPAVAVSGDAEVPLHALMVVTAALALWMAARVGERLGVDPRWTWLLFGSPALVTASVGAMADVPFLLLSLTAWGAALLGRPAAAGALAAASALAKYAGLVNVPLALLALPGRSRARATALLLAGSVVFGGWCVWNLAVHGALHVTAASRFQSFGFAQQGVFFVHFLAGLGLAGLPAALVLLRWTWPAAAAAAAGGVLVALVAAAGTSSAGGWVVAFLAGAAGTALLWSAAAAGAKARGPFLGVAVAVLAASAFVPVYFGAVRYVLPLLPPLLWVLVQGGRLHEPAGLRWTAAVGSGAVLSIAFLAADTGYAGAWRRAAQGLPDAGRGFHTGRWGFDHYAAQVGYRPLPPREVLRRGDVVAVPQGIHVAGPTPAQQASLARTGRIAVPSPWLRLMDREAGAGYYSSAWGVLPAAVRRRAFETVTLLEPAAWLDGTAPAAGFDRVAVDLGSPEARQVQLDGWSGDEAFEEAGRRRTFVWAVATESALRLPLPAGARWVRVHVFPTAEAVGRLEIAIGTGATAVLDVQPGWRRYVVPIVGNVEAGPATVVLRPAGHLRPGPFANDPRPLSVALDSLEVSVREPLDDGSAAQVDEHGYWPARSGEDTPGLSVAGVEVVLAAGPGAPLRVSFGCVGDGARLAWEGGAARSLWSAGECPPPGGCSVDVVSPAEPGRLVLSARRALVTGVHIRPDADR